MDSNETTTKVGDISQNILIGTWIMITLSIWAMVSNFITFISIAKYYPTTVTYKIQMIDSSITCITQIGVIGQLTGSIDLFRNEYVCTMATGLCLVTLLQPIVSCLFLAIVP